MTRRLWAGLFLAVLFGLFPRIHQACAKPPDLPLDQKNTCKEDGARCQNINDLVGGGGYDLPDPNLPPNQHNTVKPQEAPADFLISIQIDPELLEKLSEQAKQSRPPVQATNVAECPKVPMQQLDSDGELVTPLARVTRLFYQLPLGVRRNLATSILFTFHPLLVLAPKHAFLDIPEDHPAPVVMGIEDVWQGVSSIMSEADIPQDEIFYSGAGMRLLEKPTRHMIMVKNCELKSRWLQAIRHYSLMIATEPLPECPNPITRADATSAPESAPSTDPVCTPPAPPATSCPWHPQPVVDRYAQQLADPDVTRDVLSSLECVKKARKLLERGETLGRTGHLCEALDCFQMVEELCPGRFDDRIQSIMTELCLRLHHVTQDEDAVATASASEEQSAPAKSAPDFWHTLLGYLHCPCCCDSKKAGTEEESASSACPKCEEMHRRCVARCAKKKNPPLVFVTYPISDLIEDDVLDMPASKEIPVEEKLIRLLTSTVEPRSWCEMGGTCTIDYFDLTQSLVVGQTPENQEHVVQTLAMLRQKAQDKRAIRTQVTGLLKACRLALAEGRTAHAADLARQACALDPERVLADPLVYKMQLLTEDKGEASRGATEDSEATSPTCPFMEMLTGARKASAPGTSRSQFLAVCTTLGELVDTLLPAHGGVEIGLGFPPGHLSVGYSLTVGSVVFHVRYHDGLSLWVTANNAAK